jgi:hypothetical protein
MGQVEVLLQKGLFTEHELLEDLKEALSHIQYPPKGIASLPQRGPAGKTE